MAAEITQRIFRLTDNQNDLIEELLKHWAKAEELQKNKNHNCLIAKHIIKQFNQGFEIEPAYYPGIKSIKK